MSSNQSRNSKNIDKSRDNRSSSKNKIQRNGTGKTGEDQKLTRTQQVILTALYRFRFVSAGLLAHVLGVRRIGVYRILEQLVEKRLVTKVYEPKWRIQHRPAYYYLNAAGVTRVRKVMDVDESVIHALYKNSVMSEKFIAHCLKLILCYATIAKGVPEGTDLFTKPEINRDSRFPKTRPDMYIRSSKGQEAFIVIVDDEPLYIVRKRFEEVLEHSRDEGWVDDTYNEDNESDDTEYDSTSARYYDNQLSSSLPYPRICFIVKDEAAKRSFLYTTKRKLDDMYFTEDELQVFAAPLQAFETPLRDGGNGNGGSNSGNSNGGAATIETTMPWSSYTGPKGRFSLFD